MLTRTTWTPTSICFTLLFVHSISQCTGLSQCQARRQPGCATDEAQGVPHILHHTRTTSGQQSTTQQLRTIMKFDTSLSQRHDVVCRKSQHRPVFQCTHTHIRTHTHTHLKQYECIMVYRGCIRHGTTSIEATIKCVRTQLR